MLEKEQYHFYDTSKLIKTRGIEERAKENYIRNELMKRFPEERFERINILRNDTGVYKRKCGLFDRLWGSNKPITGLPSYYEVEIIHSTGEYKEELIIWSPVAWNDRFAGTAGGGTSTGGRNYLTRPDDTTRGWTVPYAVMNGFTAATINAGNCSGIHDYILDKETGQFCMELYENWRLRSTHNMTVYGKAVAEILHDRPVSYSYMNGGSGGGRQSLMEVQNYPEDYDGVWAACPAINWNHFLLGGLWPIAVMNEKHHFLSAKKNQFFLEQAQTNVGGKEIFYSLDKIPDFDANTCIGEKTEGGVIIKEDAEVINEIWKGPHREDGSRLWYAQDPGVKNWRKVIPIGTYYYPLFGNKRVETFILGRNHARWITGNPKETFRNITQKEIEWLYEEGTRKFADSLGDNPAIDEFVNRGGKLMIDHGIDDPLIPVKGTLDYYDKLCKYFGGKEKVDEFCRLYITPGDNHGNCWGNGPGIKESTGMKAMMEWVERGVAPGALRKVRVEQKSGKLIQESMQMPY